MAEVFAWPVRTEASGNVTLAVRAAKFGDGYQQTSADGINPKTQIWNVSRVGKEELIAKIIAFLDAHAGRSFLWTPPLSVQGYYQCKSYNPVAHGAGNYTLTATFEQHFQP
ncbi:UNVERIFIED_CONTAM: phage tail protein [Xanthomonas axonopodis]